MKAVVTGPSGHLGTNLVRELLERGHEVRALCYDRAEALDGLDVERVEGDVRDRASLAAAFAGCDALFHLAGVIDITGGTGPLLRPVNVDGVRNAAEAALEVGVRRMIHVSSVHAYDAYRLGRPLDESSPQCASARHPGYDLSKADGERELRAVIDRGLDAVVVNPTGIVGPYDWLPSLFGGFLLGLFKGQIVALPRGGFDFVDVRDVAGGILAAHERGRTGQNYLLSGTTCSLHELATVGADIAQVRGPRFEIPISLCHRFAPIDGIAARLTRKPRRLTHYSIETLDAQISIDGSRAREELGYAPRPLRETLVDTRAWFIEAGMLRPPEARRTLGLGLRRKPQAASGPIEALVP